MTLAASLLLFLLFFFSSSSSSSSSSSIPTPLLSDEVLGLVLFKVGLHDPTSALSSWSPDDSFPCSWPHIICSSSFSVSSLSLSSLSLSSSSNSTSLPPGLNLLTSLRSLSLSSNSFSGPFPSTLPCSSLRFLSLASNILSGPIHPSLSKCSLLLHLNLSSNHLSGDYSFIFSSLTRLRVLDLSFNSLSGPLPASISSLRHLKLLNLSGNQLSGRLPPSLSSLPHLLSVDFASNRLSGQLPSWLPLLAALRHVDLSRNQFQGTLLPNLSSLRDLSSLDLSFNSLTGGIPSSIADCVNLTELRLGGNTLGGVIPPSVFDLGLRVLDLAANKLQGTVPPSSLKLRNALQLLNLSGNRLVGEFPPETEAFTNLRYLNLSENQLHSSFFGVGKSKDLSILDLRSCGLRGLIPCSICSSGSIKILQLDGNSLSGPIPEEIGNCSNLRLLSLSHNELTGSIPTALAGLKKLEIMNLEFNSLSGEIPQQLGTLPSLVAANISYNRLVGRLPAGGVFPSLDESSLRGNLALCSPLVSEPCKMDEIPKPLVLDPGAITQEHGKKPASELPHQRSVLSLSAIASIAAAFVILLGVLATAALNISARRNAGPRDSAIVAGKMVNLDGKSSGISALTAASLLSKATEIGRGGFGVVYRTAAPASAPLAIRRLLPGSALQSHEEFDREVRRLAAARHPNVLSVKGYCFTPQTQLLVTDFSSGGSLESRLNGLLWPERFRIALGVARGLSHLHRACRPPVIHGNVTLGNILIDAYGEAKVADFGLGRLMRGPQRHEEGEKGDVYGFGIVLLEMVTGRKAVEVGEDGMTAMLVDEVRAVLEKGERFCVDDRFAEEEAAPLLKLGLVCASRTPSSRPTMPEVVRIMEVIKTPTGGRALLPLY